jgi:hypothetical protein
VKNGDETPGHPANANGGVRDESKGGVVTVVPRQSGLDVLLMNNLQLVDRESCKVGYQRANKQIDASIIIPGFATQLQHDNISGIKSGLIVAPNPVPAPSSQTAVTSSSTNAELLSP